MRQRAPHGHAPDEHPTGLDEKPAVGHHLPTHVRVAKHLATSRRVWFAVGLLLLALAAVMVPVALGSIVRELLLPPESDVYFLTEERPRLPSGAAQETSASYLNIAVAAVDEAKGLATLRIAGHRTCPASCDPLDLILFSLRGVQARRVGLPPSATVRVPQATEEITATVELPVGGQPSLYPFDTYNLLLAIRLQRTNPDGTTVGLRSEDLESGTHLSVQSQLQRMTMSVSGAIDPSTIRADGDPYTFLYVRELLFRRPLYLPVLAVLLVLFVTGAAIYSMCTQPIDQVLLSVGTLVLGVWGIRAILVPGYPPYVTAVDLALSLVILMLLGGIIGRSFLHLHRGGRVPGRGDHGGTDHG